MQNSSKIRCKVIAVPVGEYSPEAKAESRPSDLVPWADPYIASLITKLQAEVRLERAAEAQKAMQEEVQLFGRELMDFELDAWDDIEQQLNADIEVPWYEIPFEEEPIDDERSRDWEDGKSRLKLVGG